MIIDNANNALSESFIKQLHAVLKNGTTYSRLDWFAVGDYKERVLLPYLEKLGNCELVSLPGDHLIYEQKPDECGQIIIDFIDGLEK